LSLDQSPNRWLILILFLLGLAIGVHLLGILVIPAICFVIYFRVNKQSSIKGLVLTGVLSIFLLGFIQEGIIAGSISLASSFEVAFVNALGLPFYSGTIFFFILLIAVCLFFVRYARKKGNTILYNSFMGLIFLLIGYGSFAVIVIRSNANTPMDQNDPENLVTLHSYLKREQYGSAPILSGNYWNSTEKERDEFKDLSPTFFRRFVVSDNNGEEVKAFKKEKDAEIWKDKEDKNGEYLIDEKYYESNASIREKAVATYEQATIFPRMYSGDPNHIQGYQKWSGYNAENTTDSDEIGRDGNRLPTFGENLNYFFSYQVNWMYLRYFMWNFAGRQNDIQGRGDNMRGNWISGIDFLDEARLGSQEFAPHYTKDNPSNNKFYLLPLILALIGLIFHFSRAPKDAFVILLGFLLTGLAIVIYLNQKPFEPRERDYAYAGSFYFFAMWIGIGVYAIYDFIQRKKILAQDFQRAIIAGSIGIVIPILMAYQGWDDHNRSGKTSAHDLAYNYLMSCEKNGILFTQGDNDTFPLWYLQEVEGKRTDVRVCNLSLMGTDWYTNQMKMKAYESEPLPIKFREDQILMYSGNTDEILFIPLIFLYQNNASNAIIEKVIGMRLKNNQAEGTEAIDVFNYIITQRLPNITVKNPVNNAEFEKIKGSLLSTDLSNLGNNINQKYEGLIALLNAAAKGDLVIPESDKAELEKLLKDFEKPWMSCDLTEAMAFVRDDANLITLQGRKLSFFPTSKFTLKVNKKNAIAAGTLKTTMEKDSCLQNIEFEFNTKKVQGLNRADIMVLDILANNDWKRSIYFSGFGGDNNKVPEALYEHTKQVGMAYELSPLPIREQKDLLNLEKMYKNLTKTFHYGKMNVKGVLTDYYTRRHTITFRANFLLLAEQYLKNNKQRAIELLDFSLAKMPMENVIDVDEVNNGRHYTLTINKLHKEYEFEGEKIPPMCSGTLPEYVQLYYLAGDKKKAEVLGLKLMNNYKSIFAYFENSDTEFMKNLENSQDLIAALDACFKMRFTAEQQEDKGGKFYKDISSSIKKVYTTILPRIQGSSSKELQYLEAYLVAMKTHYGLSK